MRVGNCSNERFIETKEDLKVDLVYLKAYEKHLDHSKPYDGSRVGHGFIRYGKENVMTETTTPLGKFLHRKYSTLVPYPRET